MVRSWSRNQLVNKLRSRYDIFSTWIHRLTTVDDMRYTQVFEDISDPFTRSDRDHTVFLGAGRLVDKEFDYDEFRNHLSQIGDSLLVIADDEVVKFLSISLFDRLNDIFSTWIHRLTTVDDMRYTQVSYTKSDRNG